MAYPSQFPTSEIGHIISYFKQGSEVDLAHLAHDIWVVQGYGMKILIGDAVVAHAAKACDHGDCCDENGCVTDCAAVEMLEKLCLDDDSVDSQGLANALPWDLMIPWLTSLVTEVVKKYLDKYLKK